MCGTNTAGLNKQNLFTCYRSQAKDVKHHICWTYKQYLALPRFCETDATVISHIVESSSHLRSILLTSNIRWNKSAKHGMRVRRLYTYNLCCLRRCTWKVSCTRDNGLCRGTRYHIRYTRSLYATSGRRVKILVWILCHGNPRGNTHFEVISVNWSNNTQ